MKRKIISILSIVMIIFSMINYVYGVSASYTITDIYRFKEPTNYSSVELFIGTTDNSIYSKGNCVIKPKYSSMKRDDYGNTIVIFDNDTLKSNNYIIEVERNIICSDVKTNLTNASADYSISKLYLKPSPKVESDNRLIIDKANELIQNCEDDYSKIRNIFEFVNMNITYDLSDNYRNKGALSALKTGRGVCEEYASLFVALCRASNIPARVITGFSVGDMYEGETKDTEALAHAWAEVYLKEYGWLPVEATTSAMSMYDKVVYWDGLFNIEKPTYIYNGINNPDIPQARYSGLVFDTRECRVTLNSKMYFSDISTHWAKKNIENLYDKKVVNGYEDDSFKPENNVTRIEFMVMLCRSLKRNGNYYYSNLDKIYYPSDFISNWSKAEYDRLMEYYAYAAEDHGNKGAGYESISYVFGNKLKMNEYITREEVVALMSPFLKSTYTNNVPLTDINNSKFKKDIIKSYMNNIIKGYEDGTFNPKGNITRAEMATVLDRYTK
ncbi:MAG: hypothetical protein E7311_02555 [Clostridiales bacterium]|nr:hypothetical protein [Clostridiales bacterium]